jgi:RNA polymerase sigma-70 factor (ECF subfamily)
MSPEEPSSLADKAVLGKLLEEYRPRLLAMLRRRIDPGLAARIDPEDVCSETFLAARRRWATFNPQAPYSWLYRIALDCLIEAWRRETRTCRDLHRDLPWPEGSSLQLGLSLVNPGTSPASAFSREELRERMAQTLQLLKNSDKQILWMRHYDGLSFKDIALVMKVTENAATVRYVRALRRLKELWLKLNPDQRMEG